MGHRGPRTAAPLRPVQWGRAIRPGVRSPRSSDRGSIAAIAPTRRSTSGSRSHRGPRTAAPLRLRCRVDAAPGSSGSPRSSDRGSIAASSPSSTRGRRGAVTAVLGPRLHCGRTASAAFSCLSSCHRGPRTAAPLRPLTVSGARGPTYESPRSSDRGSIAAVVRPTLCARDESRVTAVLGPRLHCGSLASEVVAPIPRSPRSSDRGSIAAVVTGAGAAGYVSHRGPRTAAPLRRRTPLPRPHRCSSSHRGPRTAAPLRRLNPFEVRLAVLHVTAVLGPRLHCGAGGRSPGRHRPPGSPRSSDRGSIAARPTFSDCLTCTGSPRSSDRGSIAAGTDRLIRRTARLSHRGPRTAAPLRRRLAQPVALGLDRHRGPRTAAPLRHQGGGMG